MGSDSYLGGLEDPIIESKRSDAVGLSVMSKFTFYTTVIYEILFIKF